MIRAEIICIGDELLTGTVPDANCPFLALELHRLGIPILYHTTVGDSKEAIVASLRSAAARASVVIATGGLGPTADDLTRQSASEFAGKPLVFREELLAHIRSIFERRHRTMGPSNRNQAMIPEGAEVLPNTAGTAAGFLLLVGETHFFFLPGVPSEMRMMFADSVAPRLSALTRGAQVLLERRLHVIGLGESEVNEILEDLIAKSENPRFGLLALDGIVDVKITAMGKTQEEAYRLLEEVGSRVRARLGANVFGADAETIESVVARMLQEREVKIAVAESCTGGLVSKRLTDISGISSVFVEGWVTYANEAKVKHLGVSEALLRQKGAVSAEVSKAMAEGALKESGADIALGVTGIAGPTGGTPEKPVGLVYIALASARGMKVEEHHFIGNRFEIRDRAAKAALNLVRLHLLGRS